MGVCFAGAGRGNTCDVPERSKHTLDECEGRAWQRRGMPSNPGFESLIKVILSSLNSAEKLCLSKQHTSTQHTHTLANTYKSFSPALGQTLRFVHYDLCERCGLLISFNIYLALGDSKYSLHDVYHKKKYFTLSIIFSESFTMEVNGAKVCRIYNRSEWDQYLKDLKDETYSSKLFKINLQLSAVKTYVLFELLKG